MTSEVERMVSYNGGTEVDSLVYSQLEVDSPPATGVEHGLGALGATGSPKPTPRFYNYSKLPDINTWPVSGRPTGHS